MAPTIVLDFRGEVAYLVLNRPSKGNCLDCATLVRMIEALDKIEAHEEARVMVLTGSGERAFCSGLDLSEGKMEEQAEAYAMVLKRLLSFSIPVVSRVNGHCVGGGMGLVLASDLAYASEEAEFATPELRLGLFPMMVSALLLRAVPPKKGLEMVLTGRRIQAAEAEKCGLITRAVPKERLDDEVSKATKAICEGSAPALRAGIRATRGLLEPPDKWGVLDVMRERFIELLRSKEARSRIEAYFGKGSDKKQEF